MDYTVANTEQAQLLADKIRAGQIPEQEVDAALTAIEEFSATVQRPEAPEQEKLNFLQRMGENIEKRNSMMNEVAMAYQNGEQSYGESLLQTAGKYGAGLVHDFLAETLVSAGRGVSLLTPDAIEDPIKSGAKAVGNAFLNTEVGQKGVEAALDGAQAYAGWSEANPRAARNLESVLNIGTLLAPTKGLKVNKLQKGDSHIGNRLRLSATGRELNQRDDFLRDLVSEKVTPTVERKIVDQGRRETKGWGPIKWDEVTPTQAEAHAAQSIRFLGVSPAKTLVENAAIVRKAAEKEAASLQAKLKSKDRLVPLADVQKALNDVKSNLPITVPVGDAKNAADNIIDMAIERIPKHNIGGRQQVLVSDVFMMRKNVDMEFRRAGRDPSKYAEMGTAENGQYIALNELRKATNKFVYDNARIEVKGPLSKQAGMYKALDHISAKAADEAYSSIGRIYQRAIKLLPFRGATNQMAAIAIGTGGLGAGAIISEAFRNVLVSGFGSYYLYRGLAAPATRRALANVADALKPSNLAKATYNGAALTAEQMHRYRLDREYILQLLKVDPDTFDHSLPYEDIEKIDNDQNRRQRGEDVE